MAKVMRIWNSKVLLFGFAVAIVIVASLTASADEIHFSDPNLEAAIREALNKPEGPITDVELAGLTGLDASERGISDLTGIEHCINLDWLDLDQNQVRDIGPLSGLTNLQSLELPHNQISDITALSGLTNLQGLDLRDNEIRNISSLANLTSLEWLALHSNKITDLAPLSDLTNVQDLGLNSNQISDISPLSNLTNLQTLNLGGSQIDDISALRRLANLQVLDLEGNQISDITPLGGLTDLRVLCLDGNRIADISPLSGLTMIGEQDFGYEERGGIQIYLSLWDNRISDIGPLVNNRGIGDGVDLRNNPLNYEAYDSHIPALQRRGVNLLFHPRIDGILFTNVSDFAGIDPGGLRGRRGVAFGDYNNDGWLDIYASNWNALYKNSKDGTFTDVTTETQTWRGGEGVCWGDYDNDGDLDLYATDWSSGDTLYRNEGDGTFADVTDKAGLRDPRHGSGAAWADYDNDGDLDLYVSNMEGEANALYRNDGNDLFTDVTEKAGVGDMQSSRSQAWADYDNDGDLDLYVANFGANRLYSNQGDGTFVDIAPILGITNEERGGGSGPAWGDYDNDGDLDLAISSGGTACLYRNDTIKGNTFTDVTDSSGVSSAGIGGEGLAWGDYDNDGWLDLYVTSLQGSALYHNNGDGTFTDMTISAGVNSGATSLGTAWGDYDNDGDLDLYVIRSDGSGGNPIDVLYRNDIENDNYWLILELEGIKSNWSGIGARVKMIAGTLLQIREVSGGSGRASQDSLPVEFGLGGNAKADLIEIQWPSGQVDVFENVPGDQFITVKERIVELMDGILSGIITDADTNGPVSGAVVQVANLTVETNSQGKFEFSLRPGMYDVATSAREYLIEDEQVEIRPDETIKLFLSALPAVEVWPGDTNSDGRVSILDVLPIGRSWGKKGDERRPQEKGWQMGLTPVMNWNPKEAAFADADGNGIVDEEDVLVIAQNWRKTRPEVSPAPELFDSIKYLADRDMLDRYQRMYRVLNRLEDSEGTTALREALRNLIAAAKPEKSALLANYPNPFNPDTWIPFVLAAGGEVVIRIHDISGRLVRELRLGRLEPGYYVKKEKAAYWDGRNSSGERISSGTYFYNMRTGDLTATRKMTVAK